MTATDPLPESTSQPLPPPDHVFSVPPGDWVWETFYQQPNYPPRPPEKEF